MGDAEAILKELSQLGSASYKGVLMRNHGVQEPCFGVKISDLKKIQKRIKKDYRLALALYDTGNYDAMYLAGLIADDERMTRQDLQRWVKHAKGGSLCGFTVPWVAASGPHGWELGLGWIESNVPETAAAGWNTLSGWAARHEDSALDLAKLRALLERVRDMIHKAPDAARHAMNSFVISIGGYVKPLSAFALECAEKIGPVTADLGNNNCKVPFAPDYIQKIEQRGAVGKKRKILRC